MKFRDHQSHVSRAKSKPSARGGQTPRRAGVPRFAYQTLEPRQLLAADFLITEFQASNNSTLVDDLGRNSDWIEIYNAGTSSGNLQGYALSDSITDTNQWQFPSITLNANEYLIVFAAVDADPGSGTDLYTGFGLGRSGDYLGLFNQAGEAVSQYVSQDGEYPPQQVDGSFGLAFSGSALSVPIQGGYFQSPTPGEANSFQFAGIVQPVEFSVDAGFYENAFVVSLTTETSGSLIRYTLDGSEPSLSNGFNAGGSLSISESTNLRARAYKSGFITTEVETRTYLFLDDVLGQSNDGVAPAGWPADWGDNSVDYGIDPQVRSIEGDQAIKDGLLAIPSWSITTDLDNLFDPSTGIYANPLQDGRDWERPASVELIQPDGSAGFQVDAGIRIRGGFSRQPSNPKHSFRLFFRSEYGDSELNYPVHGDQGTDTFEKIDLRTAQNYSWSKEGNDDNNFITEVISRQNQGLTGQPYTRSSWLHLYINGQYWGLFQTQERAEANFAASYLGGDKDDYDVIKVDGGPGAPYNNEATDGNLDAYERLFQQAVARASDGRTPNFVNDSAYLKAQGLNPDGSRNLAYEVLLDVDNLIGYMTEILYSGNFDAPISNFLNNNRLNNYYAIRDRTGDAGFQYFVHDAEHSLRTVGRNRNGPYNHPNFEGGVDYFNPQWLHQQLMANDEYRIRFADSIQQNFFNDGLYTKDNLQARWDAEAAKIESAIIAESARWGDAHGSQEDDPLLKSDWEAAVADVRADILENRSSVVVQQFQNTVLELKGNNGDYSIVVDAPLFPDIDVPKYLVEGQQTTGGTVTAGTAVTPDSSQGTVWYTTDGSDPRLLGGGVNAAASSFIGSSNDVSVLQANSSWRYNDTGTDLGTAWRAPGYNDSGWDEGNAELGYGDTQTTELDFGPDEDDKYPTTYFRKEFAVPTGGATSATLRFIRDDGIVAYLNGVEVFRDNMPGGTISYDTTASGLASGSGETTWVEVNVPLSALQFGSTNTLATEIHQYAGNPGAPVTSSDISFNAELIVAYASSGSSPVVINESTTLKSRTLSGGEWSALQVGSFVVPSTPASSDNLRVTEVHYNSQDAGVEFIEIQNVTSGANATRIDLGGVQVTDGPSSPFQFAPVASLAPQEYGLLVSDVTAFVAAYPDVDPGLILGEFTGGLSNSGEEIRFEAAGGETLLEFTYNDNDPWPFMADGDGASLELIDPAATPANQLGKAYRWRSSARVGGTPGAAGDQPLGVVINEVLAHTDAPQSDSIELFNPTGAAIDVGGWYLSDSADNIFKFVIPAATTIPAGGYLVFDESDFNPTPASPSESDFALSSSAGDQVFLSRVVFESNVIGFHVEDAVTFGATFNGQSIGRLPNGSGRLSPLSDVSLGAVNVPAMAAPLVISELNYHPDEPSALALQVDPTLRDDDLEFIEIHNPTASDVSLEGWQIRGEVDFDFPSVTLAAGETLVVVSFDPVDPANATRLIAFQVNYDVTGGQYMGPWTGGSLSNGAGRIALRQPDTPELGFIPRVVVDEVLYDDIAPWVDADGTGVSLDRSSAASFGNDAASWIGSLPTPGSVAFTSDPPTVVSALRDEGDMSRPDLWSTLDIEFSSNVSLSAAALQLINQSNSGSAVDLSSVGFGYNAGSTTATWDFSSLDLAAGFYEISISGVNDVETNVLLDGDVDGAAGGSFDAAYYVAIPGDANQDGVVDVLNDAAALVNNLGSTGNATWANGDFSGNGQVDVLGDAAILVENLGRDVRPAMASMASVMSFTGEAAGSMPAMLPVVTNSSQPDGVVNRDEAVERVALAKGLDLAGWEAQLRPDIFSQASTTAEGSSKSVSLDKFFESADEITLLG